MLREPFHISKPISTQFPFRLQSKFQVIYRALLRTDQQKGTAVTVCGSLKVVNPVKSLCVAPHALAARKLIPRDDTRFGSPVGRISISSLPRIAR
jgi:hypothetical protein